MDIVQSLCNNTGTNSFWSMFAFVATSKIRRNAFAERVQTQSCLALEKLFQKMFVVCFFFLFPSVKIRMLFVTKVLALV